MALHELADLSVDGPEQLRQLIELFLHDSESRIAELVAAISDGDDARVAALAHSLTGSCANLGAAELSDVCRQLEREARTGQSRRPSRSWRECSRCSPKLRTPSMKSSSEHRKRSPNECRPDCSRPHSSRSTTRWLARSHDPLTGLSIRSDFLEHARRALAAERPTGGATVVFAIDLDQFHRVNDEHGHDGGDRVLVTVADRLHTLLRRHDTIVGGASAITRLGGDEFLLMFEQRAR